nr:hypothetical protein [Tanacetum cinerariifolium]
MNQVLNENERLLEQVINKVIVNIVVNSSMNNASESFQRDNSVSNQSALNFDQYFELNELKAPSQEKDTVITNLKERIKSLSGNVNKDKVKKDIDEIEIINIELDHRVSKLIAKNEHLKQTYKKLYDLIKPTRVRSKEQCDALITQHSKLNTNSKLICVKCNSCMLSDNHDLYVLNVINDVNAHPKSKSAKKTSKRKSLSLAHGSLWPNAFTPPASVDLPAPEVIALIAEVVTLEPTNLTGSSSSTNVNQDAPSPSSSQTTPETQSPVISNDVEMIVYQMDVKTTFLNDILREQVYVIQLDGFVDKDNLNHMYKLKKDLYGLKQALRVWYDLLSKFLLSQAFSKGIADPTLFIRRQGKDILLISQSPRDIFLNQSKYALESLKKYGMEYIDPVDTPMVEKFKLDQDPQEKSVDPTHYRRMVGTLMYLIASRPDLTFDDSSIALTAYADADHAGCQDTRRSTSGTYADADHAGCQDTRRSTSGKQVENGVVELYFDNTEYQLADIFTKALGKERIEFLINNMGMRSFTLETLK